MAKYPTDGERGERWREKMRRRKRGERKKERGGGGGEKSFSNKQLQLSFRLSRTKACVSS